jgi:hypothetical protein
VCISLPGFSLLDLVTEEEVYILYDRFQKVSALSLADSVIDRGLWFRCPPRALFRAYLACLHVSEPGAYT